MSKQSATDHGPCLQRLAIVMARTGLARTTIFEKVKEGSFPKPAKLGKRATGWSSLEVDKWIAERLADRDLEVAS